MRRHRPQTLVSFSVMAAALSALAVLPCAAATVAESSSVNCPSDQRQFDQHCITDPIPLNNASPKYPRAAAKSKIEASVTIKAVIGEDGRVSDAVVESCTTPGYGFETAAIEAVRKRRYKPAKIDGKVTAIEFHVIIDFKL